MRKYDGENHMVLPAAAPEDTGIYPDDEATCIICGSLCELVRGVWMKDTYLDDDGEGKYLSGRSLDGATLTVDGLVCSDKCRSQNMYRRATPSEKEALDAVLDACRVIREHGATACGIVDDAMGVTTKKELIEAAGVFVALAKGEGDEPEWMARESREETLEMAIYAARNKLEYIASLIAVEAKVNVHRISHDTLPDWIAKDRTSFVREIARSAASVAEVALDLAQETRH